MARAYRATAHGLSAVAAFIGSALISASATATATESVRETTVVRVIDGDTFEVAGGAKVRVRNFDTPELRSYECPEEKRMAQAARDAARRMLQGERVRLDVDGEDRYRRLVADVTLHKGRDDIDFVEAMIASGHGAHWNYGHEPQPDWCDAGRIATGTIEPPKPEDDTVDLDDVERALRKASKVARALEKIGDALGF